MLQAQDIKALRQKTGCGMMECKQALVEAVGDVNAAFRILREKGLAKMEKKIGRHTSEGMVAMYVADNHQGGALVEINSETDFSAKNQEFVDFAQAVAKSAYVSQCTSLDELKSAPLAGSSVSVMAALTALIGKIGENIVLRRLHCCDVDHTGYVAGYSHMGGKMATLVEFAQVDAGIKEDMYDFGRELGMHVVAMAPQYVHAKDIPADVLAAEEAIIHKALMAEGKPEAKIPMIAAGKLKKFFADVCIVSQKYVKDPKQTVAEVLSEFDPKLQLSSFIRLELGEGLAKKTDDFASEVARQVAQST